MATRRALILLGALLSVLGAVSHADAHTFELTDVVVLFKSDGGYQIDLTVDVDALALGVSPTTDSAVVMNELRNLDKAEFDDCVTRARRWVQLRVRPRFDGKVVHPHVSFPQYGTPLTEQATLPTILGTTARLEGYVPNGATAFTFTMSRVFNLVHLTVLDQATATGATRMLGVNETSPPFVLGQPATAKNRVQVGAEFLVLGFSHILPHGVDHILFVLGLFLLGSRLRPLLWQVSAFTVAHSLTLGLSMYGVVSLPARVVESLIALSIAYVAIENLFTSKLKPWRPVIVFGFGLLHGMGFAGVLREIGLPAGEFATCLIAFNVGVEAGQLAVIVMALALVGWFRSKQWYRGVIVIPVSATIAGIGLYWAFHRAMWGV